MRSYLVVDDNLPFAENLAEILGDRGDAVQIAGNGEDALALVAQHRFDAVVTDMRMPVMGGADLVQRVRRLDPGLPAIVITAYTDNADLRAARHEGLLAVLPKPVDVPTLLELLAAARRDGLVALVEDDRAFSDNLCEILRARGLTAITAASVVETQHLGDLKPFVALVDLRVPGGPDGAAMESLAQRFPALPILIITAHASVTLPPMATAAAGLFAKPFDPLDLLATIEKHYQTRA